MTYLGFHLVFIIPVIIILLTVIRVRSIKPRTSELVAIGILVVIAFLYTTPWDNFLVREQIWTYRDGAVLGTIGFVPIEEYAFFVLQTILVGLWTIIVTRLIPTDLTILRPPLAPSIMGLIVGAGLSVVGWLIAPIDSWRYMSLILVWACPVLALQWTVGGGVLWRNWRTTLVSFGVPALYLSVADRIAIGNGIWTILPGTSSGILVGGLPIEEGLFFVVTSMLVVQGILLYQWVVQLDAIASLRLFQLPEQTDGQSVSGQLISPALRFSLQSKLIWPVYAVFLLMSIAFSLGLQLSLTVQLLPLVLSAALLGLPHGAVDHLAPFRVLGRRVKPLWLLVFILVYLVPVAIYLGVWLFLPVFGFIFFILMTWYHWGSGELHTLLTLIPSELGASRISNVLAVIARGSLPMLVPLLAFPATYEQAAGAIIGSFGGELGPITWLFSSEIRFGILLLVVSINSLWLVTNLMENGASPQWLQKAGETILLFVFFYVTPPFFAVGLYFCLWHAVRHIIRLMLLTPASEAELQQARILKPLARYMLEALPLTVVSLGMLGLLYTVVPTQPVDLLSGVGLYLALIAALTLPHTILVIWMDIQQPRLPAEVG